MTTQPEFPERYVNRREARRVYGPLADRFARAYWELDPLADAAVEELSEHGRAGHERLERALRDGVAAVDGAGPRLRAVFDEVERVPSWIDWDRVEHGARTYQRIGPSAMMILSAWSLMNGYHSAPAVKPLVFTKRLDVMAPRRLAETSRFVTEVAQTGGLRRGALGYTITVRVRLVHAMVRRALRRSPEWRRDAWGEPINQADMVGTVIEFSLLVLEGARKMGFRFSERESSAVIHLWQYVGYLSGVDPWLLGELSPEPRGVEFAKLLHLVQPGPDADSLALADALRRVPLQMADDPLRRALAPWVARYHDGLARAFNGPKIADDLRVPDDAWKYAIWPTQLVIGAVERVRERVPGATALAARVGNHLVRASVDHMLRGVEPQFRPGG
ncbi:MAG: DUF2236 domain-containing protein [Polyangiaceae bacterium]|nr:DUF2236 domain-containing protein [Polyangiaceae bacterium]